VLKRGEIRGDLLQMPGSKVAAVIGVENFRNPADLPACVLLAPNCLSQREGGIQREKELPVHHKLEGLLDEYLKVTGLGNEPGSLLFPAALGKTGKLSRRTPVRTDAADMLKRRLKQAGLPAHYSPHSFRATGITNFLENDGTLEAAQRIAGHADSRTRTL
jgi:site-specific recombinase XerC